MGRRIDLNPLATCWAHVPLSGPEHKRSNVRVRRLRAYIGNNIMLYVRAHSDAIWFSRLVTQLLHAGGHTVSTYYNNRCQNDVDIGSNTH